MSAPDQNGDKEPMTMADEYRKAVSLVDQGNAGQAVEELQSLQERIARVSILSRNETLDDMTTSSIPFLALEHELAKALTQLPMSSMDRTKGMQDRFISLQRACDLWMAFFQNLENMELVSKSEKDEYHALVELSSTSVNEESSPFSNNNMVMMPIMSTNRDAKIARFNAKKQIQSEINQLNALLERRNRLGLESEGMDGHDQESLGRSLALKSLELAKQDAMEEWSSAVREIPMLERMVQQQEQDQRQTNRYSSARGGSGGPAIAAASEDHRGPPPNNKPLQVTQVTKNSFTGELLMQKQEIRSQVFQRGWNQPTMSLEELADIEVAAAMEREANQKQSEAEQKDAPRRFEQLVKDGLEDNADLVDASADLDRQWDDFKDENPAGSGNKRGDVGDRNF